MKKILPLLLLACSLPCVAAVSGDLPVRLTVDGGRATATVIDGAAPATAEGPDASSALAALRAQAVPAPFVTLDGQPLSVNLGQVTFGSRILVDAIDGLRALGVGDGRGGPEEDELFVSVLSAVGPVVSIYESYFWAVPGQAHPGGSRAVTALDTALRRPAALSEVATEASLVACFKRDPYIAKIVAADAAVKAAFDAATTFAGVEAALDGASDGRGFVYRRGSSAWAVTGYDAAKREMTVRLFLESDAEASRGQIRMLGLQLTPSTAFEAALNRAAAGDGRFFTGNIKR